MVTKPRVLTEADLAECHRLLSQFVAKADELAPYISAGCIVPLNDPLGMALPYLNGIRVCVQMVDHLVARLEADARSEAIRRQPVT
jgi:hypothetical protein